ncbi:hypothetical protein FDZ71_06400 [bacterium]|nr:MAG: hypothetical protein FDZ71_06400 [bacterium]
MRQISPTAASQLGSRFFVREVDRAGRPHILLRVPSLANAAQAELGIELAEKERAIIFTVLLYDIPTEPVTYAMALEPEIKEDSNFLRSLIDSVVFHMHPCELVGEGYEVGEAISLRLPPNLLLRLKHLSLSWDLPAKAEPSTDSENLEEKEPAKDDLSQKHQPEAEKEEDQDDCHDLRTVKPAAHGGPDPRDTVIKKLKEQVQGLRLQVKEKEKRIIELEDELGAIKSGGRQYKLEKKSWWNPF